jgi:hypothetical protein
MNLVERWFSALTTKKLQRAAHRSAKELAADIHAWVDTWNQDPKPFVWHKSTEQILELLRRHQPRSHRTTLSLTRPLNRTGH